MTNLEKIIFSFARAIFQYFNSKINKEGGSRGYLDQL